MGLWRVFEDSGRRLLSRMGDGRLGAASASRPSLLRALRQEERRGLRLVMIGRLVILSLIAAWLLLAVDWSRALPYLGVLAVFALLGCGPILLERWRGSWLQWQAAFLVLDICLLTFVMLAPNPLLPEPWPPQMNLRLFGFIYLLVLVVAVALSYSPWLVVLTGLACAAVWSGAFLLIVLKEDSIAISARLLLDEQRLSQAETMAAFLDPRAVNVTRWQNEIVVLASITMLLALEVWRSRRLVVRQVLAETGRANLSRYFSPSVAERLAEDERDFDAVSTHQVAVLFVDIVGFTGLSERHTPESVIGLLRNFHHRMARTIFGHGGTIDKYLGDGVMATFGTPSPQADDCARALRAALAMAAEIDSWNRKRTARGGAPVKIGIGLHYGMAVVGNIGDRQRLEFTVIGDTVNVASRLERTTRSYSAMLAASDALIEAAKQQDPGCAELIGSFVVERSVNLRGRDRPMDVWLYR